MVRSAGGSPFMHPVMPFLHCRKTTSTCLSRAGRLDKSTPYGQAFAAERSRCRSAEAVTGAMDSDQPPHRVHSHQPQADAWRAGVATFAEAEFAQRRQV